MKIIEKNINFRLQEKYQCYFDEIVTKLNKLGEIELEYNIYPDDWNESGRIYITYTSDIYGMFHHYFFSEPLYDDIFEYSIMLKSKGRYFTGGTAFIKDAWIKDEIITFVIKILAPWDDEECIKDPQTANEEAAHIIRSARSKAVAERKRILNQVAADCINMKKKAEWEVKEKYRNLESRKNRLDNFLSTVSQVNVMDKKELLHSLCQYMDYELTSEFVYIGEDEYKKKIKKARSGIRFYKRNKWDLRKDYLKGKPTFLKYHSDWEEVQDKFSDFFNMMMNIIIENMEISDSYKAYPKMLDFVENIKSILADYSLEISDNYIEDWTDLIRAKEDYKNYKKQKKLEEKERREREREEAKAQREYERAIKQAEKDEATARRKIEEAQKKLEEEKNNEKKYKELTEQIEKLQQALQDAIQRGERALSMAQQTKKGFVYIISNEDSFGENVYKIGLTRRLDPTERVDELSNASVPFPFSIYTIIESDDAPALEAHLHRKFDEQKINKTNWRKEFFKISKEDIDKALEEENIIVMDKEKYV